MHSFLLCAFACLAVLGTAEKLKDVKIEILEPAKECKIKSQCGDTLYWHYKGYFPDGKVFDTSIGRDPYYATLCKGHVIEGVDKGMQGMCEGEKRRMTMPPEMAYGAQGTSGIPGGSTLLFDVELLMIERP